MPWRWAIAVALCTGHAAWLRGTVDETPRKNPMPKELLGPLRLRILGGMDTCNSHLIEVVHGHPKRSASVEVPSLAHTYLDQNAEKIRGRVAQVSTVIAEGRLPAC
jgi:hypothetical protein